MGYDPSRSPSVVDNLSLGIRGMSVEDDASLSRQGSPYRNGHHTSTVVPDALTHVPVAPLQPRGPYAPFPPPDYASYYPGTPTGQRSSLVVTLIVNFDWPFPDPSMYTPSPVTPSAVPATVYPAVSLNFPLFLKHTYMVTAARHVLRLFRTFEASSLSVLLSFTTNIVPSWTFAVALPSYYRSRASNIR